MLKIKQIRQQKGISIRKLSALTGLPISTLSDLENNKKIPTPQVLAAIAKALGVDEKDLWKEG